jgi:carbon monoxide dehydrogenase subunit G
MGTTRTEIRIARPADAVWAVVQDPTSLTTWFPGIAGCTLDGDVRHVTTANGGNVDERIVTTDHALRRFQYGIVPGAGPVEYHLATIDVIEDGEGSLVVYSVNAEPDAMVGPMGQAYTGALAGLKRLLES